MATVVKSRSVGSKRKPPVQVAPNESVLYLYGVSRQGDFQLDIGGVDGVSPIKPILCSGLVCWVSRVSRNDFADKINENMQNLDWLAAAGVRHQQAVAAIAARADVLPARFATVFLTPESLERHVRDQKATLLTAFERISNCDEWGVKIHAVAGSPSASSEQKMQEVRSGREYLQRKASSLPRRPAKADSAFEGFAAELSRYSRQVIRVASQAAQPGLEWQASFLVPRRDRESFLACASQWAERWQGQHRIECTGPWPPYSFVASLGSDATNTRGQ